MSTVNTKKTVVIVVFISEHLCHYTKGRELFSGIIATKKSF
jgi:hypothetical protein